MQFRKPGGSFRGLGSKGSRAFGALRVERKLNDEALDEKTKKLSGNVLVLEELAGLSPLTELITALRLEDTRDKSHLCLWYLRLWEASCKAGAVVGAPQFSNPDGIKVGQDDRRRQLERSKRSPWMSSRWWQERGHSCQSGPVELVPPFPRGRRLGC